MGVDDAMAIVVWPIVDNRIVITILSTGKLACSKRKIKKTYIIRDNARACVCVCEEEVGVSRRAAPSFLPVVTSLCRQVSSLTISVDWFNVVY